jgi:hypothetical protein
MNVPMLKADSNVPIVTPTSGERALAREIKQLWDLLRDPETDRVLSMVRDEFGVQLEDRLCS